MYEKLVEYAMPLADHVGGRAALEMYVQNGKIEIEHLGFLRGRDLKNTIVLCSEAEHLTREHVQLLLGRISQGSILLMNGDWRQIDSRVFEQNNGLQISIDRLKGNRLFSYVHLPISVRSETAKLADLLD
jgi:PhoH-like ATPase